jgi:alcohol dehydrogenase (cytochrome c)
MTQQNFLTEKKLSVSGIARAGSRHLRTHRLAWLLATACGIYLSSTLAWAQEFASAPPSFSAVQVARGKTAYGDNCQSCHGDNLDDGEFGPPIKGPSFQSHWQKQAPASLFAFLMRKMPPSDPGMLSQQTYADIESYILQANGGKPGSTELSPAMLATADVPAAGRAAAKEEPTEEHLSGPPNHDQVYKDAIAAQTAKLNGITPVTKQMLTHPTANDWLTWRRTYDGLGHSPLAQINTRNITDVGEAWSWTLPVSPNEITPLVHDGVLFVQSANEVQALDAATGDLLWRYVRQLPPSFNEGHRNPFKNMAIYQYMLFAQTADGHVTALDIRSGKPLWDQDVVGEAGRIAHMRLDGGPIVANGKVIMGTSGCTTYKGGCFIVGLDADTGKEAWRFNTIARPGQPDGDSWNGASVDERYGGSVWTSGSYDPNLNLVYFGIGQDYNTTGLLEAGPKKAASNDAAYTDSTVALNPDTGKLVWYYQHMNRDVWDMDWVFDQTLLTLPVNGKPTDLVVTAGKLAIFDAVDRANGKYAFSKDLGLQNLVTAIDPKTGKKTINPALTPEANVTKLLCPHGGGARNWQATSYDPTTHILYVPMQVDCAQFTWIPRSAAEVASGGNDMHWLSIPRPDNDGNIGRVMAVNLETKKVEWTRPQRAPEAGSILTTDGGLMFDGAADRIFRASDVATGKVLWKKRLNAVLSSTPVTYSVNGTQYVAVVAGGGGAHEGSWVRLMPEVKNPAGGTTLWVFKLNDRNGGAQN